ncbi:MAG: hypothetical protein MRY83_24805 [Flavobacteriales bacterium]|nr:hypothetical protein [Flavobacteriales bacterium]
MAMIFVITSCSHYERLGDKAYENLEFQKAIKNYSKIKNRSSEDAAKLASSYMLLNQYEQATIFYEEALKKGELSTENHLRYAMALQASGDFEAAEIWYTKYHELEPEREIVLDKLNYLDTTSFKTSEGKGIASKMQSSHPNASDYSPLLYNGKLIFSSERNLENDNQTAGWTGRPHSDLYQADINSNGVLYNIKPFMEDFSTEFGEGAVAINKNGNEIYYTKHNLDESNNVITSKNDVVHLQIYRLRKDANGQWFEPEKLEINGDDYSCMHPTLSSNGKWLYYASDMSNPNGQTDLYVSYVDPLTKTVFLPIKLSDNINSDGDELFPVINNIHGTDYLYYSSDLKGGPGGLDIYKVKRKNIWTEKPSLLPKPINSTKDDAGLTLSSDGSRGYFSTNPV